MPAHVPLRLADRFPVEAIRENLLPPGTWRPYPTIRDRNTWESLPAEQRQSLVAAGEALLGTSWPELKATLFMEYQRTGFLTRYQQASFERRKMLIRLVLAECVENQGRFLDDIVNGLWAICEESYWGASEHSRNIRFTGVFPDPLPDTLLPGVDLTTAETGALVAYTDYLIGGVIEHHFPIVTDRLHRELRRRLLDPYTQRNDWHWLGFNRSPGSRPPNNWNPWVHSNLLAIEMAVEKDEFQRAHFVHRVLRGLDEFLSGYHEDGGCDEGVAYWGRAGASLFECLDVLDTASDGKITVWDEPLIREMGRFILRMHIGSHWYVSFADSDAKTIPDPNLVYHFARKVKDEQLQTHALASLADQKDERSGLSSFNRVLNGYFRPVPAQEQAPAYPLIGQSWLAGIQVLTARETEGSSEGLFLAAKGGHNGESHNHNDVGTFIVGLDGQPVLIDAGVEDYISQTFSPRRYELWTMQSSYHNLPTIDGIQQQDGPAFRATDVSADLAENHASLRFDMSQAWPAETGIDHWQRTIELRRGQDAAVTVHDDYTLAHDPESLSLTLMAYGRVDPSAPGQLRITGLHRDLLVDYDATMWQVSTERIPIGDKRMGPVWGDHITRILLQATNPTRNGSFMVRAYAG